MVSARLAAFAPPAFGGGARVALGALVTVDDDGERKQLRLAPDGGGTALAAGPCRSSRCNRRWAAHCSAAPSTTRSSCGCPSGLRTLAIVAID